MSDLKSWIHHFFLPTNAPLLVLCLSVRRADKQSPSFADQQQPCPTLATLELMSFSMMTHKSDNQRRPSACSGLLPVLLSLNVDRWPENNDRPRRSLRNVPRIFKQTGKYKQAQSLSFVHHDSLWVNSIYTDTWNWLQPWRYELLL